MHLIHHHILFLFYFIFLSLSLFFLTHLYYKDVYRPWLLLDSLLPQPRGVATDAALIEKYENAGRASIMVLRDHSRPEILLAEERISYTLYNV